MRGKKTFNELTGDKTLIKGNSNKGRNSHLIDKRNMLLLYRYYFYARLSKLRYEDVIEKLVKEFYLAPATIVRLVSFDEIDKLNIVRDEKPNVETLQKAYPHLNWKMSTLTNI